MQVHTKRRNKLDVQQASDCVFVPLERVLHLCKVTMRYEDHYFGHPTMLEVILILTRYLMLM
jgi:hypothetical protein